MPTPTNVPGWERLTASEVRELGLKPSAGLYVDPSGDVRSFTAFANAQARQSGFENREDYLRWQRQKGPQALLQHFRRTAKPQGTEAELQPGGKGLKGLREAFYHPDGSKIVAPSQRAGGRLARFPGIAGLAREGCYV